MDSILEELISQLPPPEFELTASNIKTIQSLIPVPNDYEIIWTDIRKIKEIKVCPINHPHKTFIPK